MLPFVVTNPENELSRERIGEQEKILSRLRHVEYATTTTNLRKRIDIKYARSCIEHLSGRAQNRMSQVNGLSSLSQDGAGRCCYIWPNRNSTGRSVCYVDRDKYALRQAHATTPPSKMQNKIEAYVAKRT